MEEALRRPLRTNEAMFSQAITCFALLDRDYRFIRVNESFAREYQRDAHEFVGRRLGELLPAYAADDDRRRRLLDDLVLSKRPAQFSSWPYEFVDQPERSTTYWDWILQPILDEHGEVEFVFVSGIDVTERRRAESTWNVAGGVRFYHPARAGARRIGRDRHRARDRARHHRLSRRPRPSSSP